MAVDWLKIKDPDYEVPFDVAVQKAREMPLGDRGGNNNPDGINQYSETGQGYNITLTKTEAKRGTNKEYLLRRLSRDNPEMLDKIESGELTTRQAAIQSGIIDEIRELM